MNEPTPTPPPPPPAAGPPPTGGGTQPPKKKGGALKWVLIGCLGLILVSGLFFVTCSMFVAKKAKDFAGEMSENPAGTLARMAVRANPDLEIVEDDPEAGKLTIRDKRSGEEITIDYEDIQEGRISFDTPEGKLDIDAQGGADGVVRMETPEGERTVYGAGGDAADLPDWIPAYAGGSAPEVAYTRRGGGTNAGAYTFTTSDSPSRVIRFYEEALQAEGFEVVVHSAAEGGLVTASSDDGRTAQVTANREDDGTKVAVNFSESE